jgi:hypothetical protein
VLKGRLLLRQGHTEAAEELYRKALCVAEEQEAKLWELRAAVSLARLRRAQGRQAEAHNLLTPVGTVLSYSAGLMLWAACIATVDWSISFWLVYRLPDTLSPGPTSLLNLPALTLNERRILRMILREICPQKHALSA